MATDEQSLVREVRAITGYTDESIISDIGMLDLVSIAKQELRSDLGLPELTFHQSGSDTYQADRALFWLTAIFSKVRGGEIGNINLSIGDVIDYNDAENEYSYWFQQFNKRRSAAANLQGSGGPSSTLLERDDERTYEYNQPT